MQGPSHIPSVLLLFSLLSNFLLQISFLCFFPFTLIPLSSPPSPPHSTIENRFSQFWYKSFFYYYYIVEKYLLLFYDMHILHFSKRHCAVDLVLRLSLSPYTVFKFCVSFYASPYLCMCLLYLLLQYCRVSYHRPPPLHSPRDGHLGCL